MDNSAWSYEHSVRNFNVLARAYLAIYESTFVLSYESTFVPSKVRKYFQSTFVLSYFRTKVRRYVYRRYVGSYEYDWCWSCRVCRPCGGYGGRCVVCVIRNCPSYLYLEQLVILYMYCCTYWHVLSYNVTKVLSKVQLRVQLSYEIKFYFRKYESTFESTTCTFVLSYFRTKVLSYLRRYFRTFVQRTFVPSYIHTYNVTILIDRVRIKSWGHD